MTRFAQTTITTSRFTLKDKCRSEKWEVYLYGDMTFKVMGPDVQKHCGVLRSCTSLCDGIAFLGRVHRYTARVPPPSGAGKGWRGRRELAPRCSATRIRCTQALGRTDSLVA